MEQSEEDWPKEGEQLSGEQRRQLRSLVEEISGVFQIHLEVQRSWSIGYQQEHQIQ